MTKINDLNASVVHMSERRRSERAARERSMAAHPAGKAIKPGEWHDGYCDGCELRTVQRVKRVSGHWGTAIVCTYHGSRGRWIDGEV